MNSSYYYLTPWITKELINSVDSVCNASTLFLSSLFIPPIPPHHNLAFYRSSSDSYICLLICLFNVYFKPIWFNEDMLGDRISNINFIFSYINTFEVSRVGSAIQQYQGLGSGSVCCIVCFAFLLSPWSQYGCYSYKYHLHS